MNQYEKLFQRLKKYLKDLGVSLNRPASTSTIKQFENFIGKKLPSDIIEFYTLCNGFETDDHLFRVIPIEEIIEYNYECEPASF